MINIYLNQPQFEYDVHSLVKAFFPREEVEMYYTFAEEAARGRQLAVRHFAPEYVPLGEMQQIDQPFAAVPMEPDEIEGNASSESDSINAVDRGQTVGGHNDQIYEISYQQGITTITWLYEGSLHTTTFPTDATDRREAKNAVKRGLYRLISDTTGMELPWGGLTGIRPTKLPMKLLEEGWEEADVRQWMCDTYLASPEKAALSVEIAQRERLLLADIDYENNCSLYVDIPFCPTTCLYCSFTSYPLSAWASRVDEYLDAVEREMDFTAERCRDKKMNTVYIGGGTPTTLTPAQMERLIRMIRSHFDLSICREFTVEAGRPDSITWEKLLVMKENGVERISVNPQTMKQETLDLIGRRHTVEQTIAGYELARKAGFTNINMDLIMGLPRETVADAAHTMGEIAKLGPESVTVHSLAMKRAARLSVQWETYRNEAMVNTQEHMDLCEQYCRRMGLAPYYLYRQKGMAGNLENVGYAAPGKEGLYNILMMEEKQSIMALGAGATTKLVMPNEEADAAGHTIYRIENVKDISNYLQRTDEMIARKARKMEETGWH